MLRLTADGLDDDSLHALFASTAPRSIVLIEDVDSTITAVRRCEGRAGSGGGGGGGGGVPFTAGGMGAWAGGGSDGGRGGAVAGGGVSMGGGGGVTLAGLLNAIDGVAAQVRYETKAVREHLVFPCGTVSQMRPIS